MSERHFPESPELRFYDPLAELLGVGDGVLYYRFDDVVKLSGHACPTVAGAFVLVKRACEQLYGEGVPQRGDLRITLPGPVDAGVNGPISQVFTFLTGAAAENGFHGLAGRHARNGLLHFADGGEGHLFERISSGCRVRLAYDPTAMPEPPGLDADLKQVLQGTADRATTTRFRQSWRDRVAGLVADGGRSTVRLLG